MDNKEIKELNRLTYARIAQEYSERDSNVLPISAEVEAARQDLANRLLPGAAILDLGCGSGRDSRMFHSLRFAVTGIDISPDMLAQAKRQAPDIEYLELDMELLDLAGRQFDAVWANASLLHLPKDSIRPVLRQLHTVLTPNGLLFIKVKQGNGERVADEERFNMRIQRFYSFYQTEELKELVEEERFKTLRVSSDSANKWIDLLAVKANKICFTEK